MTLIAARQVADAVLYEGYLLYPYRASAAKNQVRWQFGVLGPAGAAAAGAGEATSMSAEMVLQAEAARAPGEGGGVPASGGAPAATVSVYLRFLQVQARDVQRCAGGGWEPVDELLVGDTRWVPFHEAVAREVPVLDLPLDPLAGGRTVEVGAPAGEEVEDLRQDGRLVGRLVRTRWALRGTVTVTTRPGVDPRVVVLGVAVENRTGWSARPEAGSVTGPEAGSVTRPEAGSVTGPEAGATQRDLAARRSFVGTHLLVSAAGARFVSLLDGPGWADLDTSSCVQHRCWPVMVADDSGTDAILVSPIVLGDHPSIAPESAGDLFDATEIDEILTLRVQTMTEQEKAEARGTDPRAAAILSRCDGISDDALAALHGTRRAVPVAPPDGDPGAALPWWDERRDAGAQPECDSILVGGTAVAKGSRVLLRPRRRADAQDLFLAGLSAVVARVYFDVDGGTHLAVVLEDDPAGDLYDTTGRFYYFGPEEIEPLPAREDAR